MSEGVGRYRTYLVNADTSRTTLYTCPPNCRAIVRTLVVELSSGSGTKATVEIYSSSSSTRFIIHNDGNLPYSFQDQIIVLEAGDRIEITSGTGTSPTIDGLVTVEEIFIPVGG